ncbi:BatD family protein [Pseudoalteromonas prydzensis]|uniref:BatD family protein n=1 Tax=Pseudoalteromonas prydzensis TaxID=182141 RepID=UPI0007E505D1|nr:BatD family protein [Pseudoalteromonas prydzensis]
MRFLLIFLLAMCTLPSLAAEPKVTVSLSDENPLVGQVTTVKVKVLVPTWFAKPLYFDEIDTVNVINVKGNKSTYPTSERFGSTTWTGVIKEYPVIAMAQGRFELKLPTLKIHFMDENSQAINREVTPPPITFNATLPELAKTLKPIIIAENIALQEDVNIPDKLTAGQSIQRKISATITASSALFIPQMMNTTNTEQQQSYPITATSNDTLNDRTATLTGLRTEQQDIVVKQAGNLSLPSITISYYQPSTNSIQTAEVKGSEVIVAAPPASLKTWLWRLLFVVICLIIVWGGYRISQFYWLRYQHSEYAHFKHVIQHIEVNKVHYSAFIAWRDSWQMAIEKSTALQQQNQSITLDYEQALYGNKGLPDDFAEQLKQFRAALKKENNQQKDVLSPLNP